MVPRDEPRIPGLIPCPRDVPPGCALCPRVRPWDLPQEAVPVPGVFPRDVPSASTMCPRTHPRMCPVPVLCPQDPPELCQAPHSGSQTLCPLSCSPLPFQLLSPGSLPTGEGCLGSPRQLWGWLGLQARRGRSPQPTAHCRMGKGPSCCQDTLEGHLAPGLCPAPRPVPEEHGQPLSPPRCAAGACGHLGTFLQEPQLCHIPRHCWGSAPSPVPRCHVPA